MIRRDERNAVGIIQIRLRTANLKNRFRMILIVCPVFLVYGDGSGTLCHSEQFGVPGQAEGKIVRIVES